MSVAEARKVCLEKYAHPSKIKKTTQSYTTLYTNPRVLYYILVRNLYSRRSSKKPNNDTLLETLYYIMDGLFVDFVELILDYVTKVCNMSRSFPLLYSNLLTHILKYFNISLDTEKRCKTHIPTINENTLKSFKFKSLPSGHWKYKEKISTDGTENLRLRPRSKSFLLIRPSGLKKMSRR